MGIFYNTSVVRNGLILHLDAANRKSYPGTGTTWTDLSGQNNHFTLLNSPTYDGRKFTFNGTTQSAVCTNTTCGNMGTSSFCMEYCVNMGSPPTSFASVIMKGGFITSIGSASANRWAHRVGNDTFFIQDNNPPSGGGGTAIPVLSPVNTLNSICHYVVNITRTGLNSTTTIFVNNIIRQTQLTTYVGTGDVSNNNAVTLWYTPGENAYLGGDMYFVRFYNRALTITEIRQNFEATRDRYGI